MANESGEEEGTEPEYYSPLSQAEPVERSEDELQAHQTAIDQIHDIISRLSALEWAERRKPEVDSGRLSKIHSRIMYFVDARDNLRIADHETVRKIQTECSQIRVSGDFGID